MLSDLIVTRNNLNEIDCFSVGFNRLFSRLHFTTHSFNVRHILTVTRFAALKQQPERSERTLSIVDWHARLSVIYSTKYLHLEKNNNLHRAIPRVCKRNASFVANRRLTCSRRYVALVNFLNRFAVMIAYQRFGKMCQVGTCNRAKNLLSALGMRILIVLPCTGARMYQSNLM